MDVSLLHRNGAKNKIPAVQVIGEEVSLKKPVRIKIQGWYVLPQKVSSILRIKSGISQQELDTLLLNDRIKSDMGQDLKKCKWSSSKIMITISR